MESKETIEEAAKRIYPIFKGETYIGNNKKMIKRFAFINGAKYQQQKNYSDMQEYAEFCIECDRQEITCLCVEDWYEIIKK